MVTLSVSRLSVSPSRASCRPTRGGRRYSAVAPVPRYSTLFKRSRLIVEPVAAASPADPYVDQQQLKESGANSNSDNKPVGSQEQNPVATGIIQRLLWSCRNLMLFAVMGSLVMSVLMFLQGIMGVGNSFMAVVKHATAGSFTIEEPDVALACVEILDKFLAGIVTFLFGTGVFELFISPIVFPGEEKRNGVPAQRPVWLHCNGIEELEMRLGKVVITILVVNLMAAAKKVTITQPHHLLFIGGALFLAALAMTVLHWVDSKH
uniref:Uncharacterized protein n=1 Tax=Tetraselmis sp. GSL018 TaxID=582737 RepID=A0A061S6S9_9CHLO